jgi:hypothetical protein
MASEGRVSIDINDHSQSVTRTVKKLLGDAAAISSANVRLLANGWLHLRNGDDNLYISPHAVESVLVEDGDIGVSL